MAFSRPSGFVDWPLAQAAREVDRYAVANDVEAAVTYYGLEVHKLVYLSEQLALQAIKQLPTPDLEPDEVSTLLVVLTAAYMDGLMIGWRGREIADNYSD